MMNEVRTGGKLLQGPAVREPLWFLFYLGATFFMTWPLARFMTRAVSDPGDPFLNTWILHWDWISTLGDVPLFHGNIFHPSDWTLAFSEHLYGIALFTFPFRLAGADPLLAYNIAMILGFTLSGYGAHVLVRVLLDEVCGRGLREAAAVVGGLFFAFVPFRFSHLAHLQHIWAGWIPLMIAAIVLYLRSRERRHAVLFAAAFFFNGLSNIHWYLFSLVVVPFVALLVHRLQRPRPPRSSLSMLASAFLLANFALIPFLLPYKIVSDQYGMERDINVTTRFSAAVGDWTVAPAISKSWSWLNREMRQPERTLFPGVVIVILSVAAARVRNRREDEPSVEDRRPTLRLHMMDAGILLLSVWALVAHVRGADTTATIASIRAWSVPALLALLLAFARLWIAFPSWLSFGSGSLEESARRRPVALSLGLLLIGFGLIGSLGLHAPLHAALYSSVEPFRALRVPARWAIIGYCGLSLTGAVGFVAIARQGRLLVRGGLLMLVVAALLFDLRAAPILWHLESERTPRVYSWISAAPISGAVLELPMGGFYEHRYVYRSTIHNKPIINGVSGFETQLHNDLVRAFGSEPVPEGVTGVIEWAGCSTIVVHDDFFGMSRAVREWLADNLASGRLRFIKRFDHHVGGDYVFAVVANEPLWPRLSDGPPVDGAGRAPQENLRRFLREEEPVYVDDTFGYLIEPAPEERISGSLTVWGWVLSPSGIERVDLLFENESISVPATLVDLPSLKEQYPWYEVSEPGFTAVVSRPEDVSERTDLIVKITDGRGGVVRLPPRIIRWVN